MEANYLVNIGKSTTFTCTLVCEVYGLSRLAQNSGIMLMYVVTSTSVDGRVS